MMYETLFVALLATSALARPQHGHKHHHHHPSGSAPIPTGTGAPFPAGNSTGPYANGTGTGVPGRPIRSTLTNVVTMTVVPLPASSADSGAEGEGSAVDVNNQAANTASSVSCAAGRSTTTVTTTEKVTVTVDEPATTSSTESTSATESTSTIESTSASSSETPAVSPGQFFASSSQTSVPAPASTSYSTSTVAPSSTEVPLANAVIPSTTVASSSAPSATATSASGTDSSSKRGLAYNDVTLTELWQGKPISWAYNWAAGSGGAVGQGLEYVPMDWCSTNSLTKDQWTQKANDAIASGSSHLLSFNEPDQPGQCNISPAAAAAGHIDRMNQFSGKAKIGSPAVTNGGGDMGLNFLSNFFTACNGQCKLDFMAIHWYNGYYDGVADDFKNHVNSAVDLASKNGISKVWITEFALNGASAADTATFLGEVLPFLDSNASVERYAFFMCSDGSLTNGNAISAQIGAAYVAV